MDKEPAPGFSRELVSVDTPPDCYDDFGKLAVLQNKP